MENELLKFAELSTGNENRATLENRHQKNFDVNCCSSYSLNVHALLIFYKITHVLHEFEDANKRCRDYKNAKIKCKDMERQ